MSGYLTICRLARWFDRLLRVGSAHTYLPSGLLDRRSCDNALVKLFEEHRVAFAVQR